MAIRHPVVATDRNWRGLNLKEPDTNLDPTESPDLSDIDFFNRMVAKRRGAERFNQFVLPGMSLYVPTDNTNLPHVAIPSRTAYDFGAGDFTVEFGFNFSVPTTDANGTSVPPQADCTALCKDTTFNWTYRGAGPTYTSHWEFAWLDALATNRVVTTGTYFEPNRDYYLTVSRSTTLLSVYVDGVLNNTADCTSGVFTTNSYQLVLGAYNTSGTPAVYSGFLTARIGEVRLWNVARTAAQIAANANRQVFVDERTASLVGYWRGDDGSGYRVLDLSAQENHGYRRPNPPEWVPGLMVQASSSQQPADYALRFDGFGSYAQIEEKTPGSLVGLQTSSYWTIQFRTYLESTATNQTIFSYGPPHTTWTTYGFSPSVLQVYTAQSGAATVLAAEFGGFEGATVLTTRTAVNLLHPTSLSPTGTYDVSVTRASGTAYLALRALGDTTYTQAQVAMTWTPPRSETGFPVILGGLCGPVAVGVAGTQTTYVFTARQNFTKASVDEVRLWRKSLVGNEQQDTELSDPQTQADLIGYFRFHEGSGTFSQDASASELDCNLLPTSSGPTYQTGVVEPLKGPPVYGASYYQKVDAVYRPGSYQERCLIAQAGADLWRFDPNGNFQSLKTGLTPNYRSSFETHRDLLIWANGIDRNQKYNGTRVENLGVDAPTTSASLVILATNGTLTHSSALPWGGLSRKTAFATDRTETLNFWDGYAMRFTGSPLGVPLTLTETVAFYSPPTNYNNASWLLWAVTGTPTGVRASYVFRNFTPFGSVSAIPRILLTSTAFLERFLVNSSDPSVNAFTLPVIASTPYVTGSESYGYYAAQLTFSGNVTEVVRANQFWAVVTSSNAAFCFSNAVTLASFSTHPYAYLFPQAGTISGTNRWAVTFYNSRTLTESDLSPVTTSQSFSSNVVRLEQIPVSTDAQVDQRWIYRESDESGEWFLVDVIDDNTTTVFNDDEADSVIQLASRLHSQRHAVPPNAAFLRSWQDRTWYAGIPATPNRVYASEAGFPEYVPAENFLDVDTGDGDVITGLGVMADTLLIFKRTSTWAVRGVLADEVASDGTVITGLAAARVEKIDSGIGCFSHFTIVPVENKLIWASDRGVFSYDGTKFEYLSEALEPFFRLLNNSRLPWTVAGNRRLFNSYILSLPSAVSGENDYTLVLDYVTGVWSSWSRKASSYVRFLNLDGSDQLLYFDYHGFGYIVDRGVAGTPHYNEIGTAYTASQLMGTIASVGTAIAGFYYDFSVSGTPFPTSYDGLKGQFVRFYRSGTLVGTDVIVWNSSSRVRTLQGVAFAIGDTYEIGGIPAYIKTSWNDLGIPEHPKRLEFVHFDQNVLSTGTVTVAANFNRYGTVSKSLDVALNAFQQRIPLRGRGYHVQLVFSQHAPNQWFGFNNLSFEIESDRVR